MPPRPQIDPQYLDEHHQRISEFAAEYIDEDEREAFVDTLLERRGYQRTSGWAVPPPPDPNQPPAGGGGAPPPGSRRPGYFKR